MKGQVLLALVLLSFTSIGQVLINEVFINPAADPSDPFYQSLADCNNQSFGEEWIEIYNASRCDSIDIGCYMLGSSTDAANSGTFSFPAGTVIPPLGFFTIGGANVSNADFVVNTYCGSSNFCGPGQWSLNNDYGWVALYDQSGNVADAVFWTAATGEANQLGSNVVYASQPCVPSSCSVSSLKAAKDMTPGTEIAYIGKAAGAGLSMFRPNDGMAGWQTDGTPTRGTCNGSCATPSDLLVQINSYGNETCQLGNGWAEVSISGGTAPYDIDWSNDKNIDSIVDLSAGSFTVTVTDTLGCSAIAYVTLVNIGDPVAVEIIPADTTIFRGDSVHLNVSTESFITSYLWSPDRTITCLTCAVPEVYPTQIDTYTVTVIDSNGCIGTASVIVKILSDENSVFIPTAFTPGIPGPNAFFIPRSPKLTSLELHIFDRWGNEVFSTKDMNESWNGTNKSGMIVDAGIYVYYAVANFVSGKSKTLKGDVAVLR